MSEDAARTHAFDIGRRLALPVRARTLTDGEVRRRAQRWFWIVVAVSVAVAGALVLGLATDGGLQSRMVLAWVAPLAALIPVVAVVDARRRLREQLGYRDPQVNVAVDEGGVAIDWGGQRIDLPWAEVQHSLHWLRSRAGTVWFRGVRLETPMGPLHINDQWFSGGRDAAAAIVTAQDQWRVLRRTG